MHRSELCITDFLLVVFQSVTWDLLGVCMCILTFGIYLWLERRTSPLVSEDILTEFSLAVGLSWVFLREVGLIKQRRGLLKEPGRTEVLFNTDDPKDMSI